MPNKKASKKTSRTKPGRKSTPAPAPKRASSGDETLVQLRLRARSMGMATGGLSRTQILKRINALIS